MFQLLTFGGLLVEPGEGSAADPRLRPKALALLAMLAAAGERGCTRERLIGLFWPDVDEEHGRHSLRQLLYAIRSEAGNDLVRAESSLFLDPTHIQSDLAAFHAAAKAGDWMRAAAIYRGPFLDGFYLSGAPEFERWVEQERARLAGTGESALQALATDATARRDAESAARWWHRLTLLDPLSGRYAMGYVRALAAAGDRPKALAFLREHETVVRRELESEPDPEIRKLEAELRDEGRKPAATLNRAGTARETPPTVVAASVDVQVTAPAAAPASRRRRLGIAATAVLALAVVATLSMLLTGRGRGASTRSDVAARLYEEGLRVWATRDLPVVRRLMGEALREDPTFAMAAYYLALATVGDEEEYAARQLARRLAQRAPERERLMITAEVLGLDNDPGGLAAAREWAARFPREPGAHALLGVSLVGAGEWVAGAAALERAVALEIEAQPSARGPTDVCMVCEHYSRLVDLYHWWDSLPAAERVALRWLDAKPDAPRPWLVLALASARAGDGVEAIRYLNRLLAATPLHVTKDHEIRIHLLLEDYERVEREVGPLLASPRVGEVGTARWLLPVALRNQGRLAEAERLVRTGMLRGVPPPIVPRVVVDYINEGTIALESGNPGRAASAFATRGALDRHPAPGHQARWKAWHTTLSATALAAAGDTAAVRRLADTVQYWGERSGFGRDRRLHHFLRGLLLAQSGNDSAAVDEYRAAVYSWSLGYTRVNYELGKSLLRLGRADEAIAAVAPALRGEVDAANLYVTRTELHELLAEAYRRAGKADSAAMHDRAVVRAWARADPRFAARREAARLRLAGLSQADRRTGGLGDRLSR